jgi:hypothetical protein
VQPSSLIFVAVVAIWAAFLLQHWVRRREAMGIARSVDRFSDAMRLLDRRPVAPSSTPRPTLTEIVSSPLVARGSRPAATQTATGATAAVAASGRHPRGATAPLRAPAPRDSVHRDSAQRDPALRDSAQHGAPRRQARARQGRLARRLLAVALLAALLSVPTTIVLAALGTVPWWSVGAAGAGVLLGILLLRYAAVRERTRRRLDRSIAASLRGATSGAATPVVGASTESAGLPGALDATQDRATQRTDGAATEVTAASRGERAAYRAGLTGPTWSPVPVPRPTYMLKDRVHRPEPVAEPVPIDETPAEPQHESVEPIPVRRAVVG